MDSYQREIVDFLENYGAAAVSVHQNGGKHPKVEFDWRGKRIAYTIASSSSDVRAAANAVANLKRLLGDPIEEEKSEPRKLENMLPPAPDLPRYMGQIAMYHTGHGSRGLALRFYLPPQIVEWINARATSVERLAHDTWLLTPRLDGARRGMRAPRLDGAKWMVTAAPRLAAGYDESIGMSPAEYMIVEDTLRVRLLLDQIRPLSAGYQQRAQVGAANRALATPALSPENAWTAAHAIKWVEPPLTPHAVLEAIAQVERTSPYRLVRLKDTGWAWQAPTIKLEE